MLLRFALPGAFFRPPGTNPPAQRLTGQRGKNPRNEEEGL